MASPTPKVVQFIPPGPDPERRLAAVMSADIAGYSALMSMDEEGTIRELRAHQSAVLPLVEAFHGKLIDTAGDGILARFETVWDAFRCAEEIQVTMAHRQTDTPSERKMVFRIGISQGDVFLGENRVYGNGVNIAARIQALCEPGQICVSAAVRESLDGKVGVSFTDLGECRLKNISRPVRVFVARKPSLARSALNRIGQPSNTARLAAAAFLAFACSLALLEIAPRAIHDRVWQLFGVGAGTQSSSPTHSALPVRAKNDATTDAATRDDEGCLNHANKPLTIRVIPQQSLAPDDLPFLRQELACKYVTLSYAKTSRHPGEPTNSIAYNAEIDFRVMQRLLAALTKKFISVAYICNQRTELPLGVLQLGHYSPPDSQSLSLSSAELESLLGARNQEAFDTVVNSHVCSGPWQVDRSSSTYDKK